LFSGDNKIEVLMTAVFSIENLHYLLLLLVFT